MKQKIRRILESHLVDLDNFSTAWEGVTHPSTLPYQSIYLTISSTETGTIGSRGLAEESGFLQINLFFPNGEGSGKIEARAEQLREHFYGLSLIDDGIQVITHQPPLIGGLFLSGNSLALPITIYFTAYELEA